MVETLAGDHTMTPEPAGMWTSCPHCGGHGLVGMWVGDYSIGECAECHGLGRWWVYPSDRIALWPGGPLHGSWPGRTAELVDSMTTYGRITP